jgi:hypothetical protein
LGKWGRWELTRHVLRLWEKTPEAPVLRRPNLRFALASPQPEAAAFLKRARREAPEEGADAEAQFKPLPGASGR